MEIDESDLQRSIIVLFDKGLEQRQGAREMRRGFLWPLLTVDRHGEIALAFAKFEAMRIGVTRQHAHALTERRLRRAVMFSGEKVRAFDGARRQRFAMRFRRQRRIEVTGSEPVQRIEIGALRLVAVACLFQQFLERIDACRHRLGAAHAGERRKQQ